MSACPNCREGDDRFHYWPETGNYWCRICELKGFVDQAAAIDPARLAELESRREARERHAREQAAAARERIAALGSRAEYYHASLTPEARAWWHAKGVSDATIDRYKLGYTASCPTRRDTESYTIPYYYRGRLVNIRHRLARDIAGKYRPEFAGLGNAIFNADRLGRRCELLGPGRAVIVEGEIKAIVLSAAGFRVVGLPGAASWPGLLGELREALERAGITSVVIAFDPGADDQARRLARELTGPGLRARAVSLPDKPDDLLVLRGWGPGELLAALTTDRERAIQARREAALAAALERREAREQATTDRAAELTRRRAASDKIAWLGDSPIDPDQVEYMRARFTDSGRWAAYVARAWPDLDAEKQRLIKLAENREAREARCGEYHRVITPTGRISTQRWRCGSCDKCAAVGAWHYRRALAEIQGLPVEPLRRPAPLTALQADTDPATDTALGENAPPLARVGGDLSLVTVHTDTDRLALARELRRAGIAYRSHPYTDQAGALVYDFIVNDGRGDPLLLLTDGRLAAWVRGCEGKRASGALLPSLKELQKRYRPALPFEVVMPELDDGGEPVDPDIFAFDLPGIGTAADLPPVVVDFRVYDRDTLQAALLEIHQRAVKILTRRGNVNYGVYRVKKFYTRYSTLDRLLADFNAWQAQLRAKKGLPPL